MESKISRHVRFLYDWIWVLFCAIEPPWIAQSEMNTSKHVEVQSTEFMLQLVLNFLPRMVKKSPAQPCDLVFLEEASLPDHTKEETKLSSVPPKIRTPELVAINRKQANKTGEGNERCLLDGIDSHLPPCLGYYFPALVCLLVWIISFRRYVEGVSHNARTVALFRNYRITSQQL